MFRVVNNSNSKVSGALQDCISFGPGVVTGTLLSRIELKEADTNNTITSNARRTIVTFDADISKNHNITVNTAGNVVGDMIILILIVGTADPSFTIQFAPGVSPELANIQYTQCGILLETNSITVSTNDRYCLPFIFDGEVFSDSLDNC